MSVKMNGLNNEKNEFYDLKENTSQKGAEKIGLLKKFLGWVAKGADESHRDKTSCPT